MSKAVINYGHGLLNSGGYDPGAIGPTGYQEATQNKEVGELVVKKLRANGWDILAIQDGDLGDITNQANSFKPDIFLSIHANSAVAEAHGIETYALAPGGTGEKVAVAVQRELVSTTRLSDRGVKFANFWVLRKTIGYPAVLTEVGFVSNPAEEALMKQDAWDDKVASAICRGLCRAMGVAYIEGGVAMTVPTVNAVASTKSLVSIAPGVTTISSNDLYLCVRVEKDKAAQAIVDINKLGYAAKILPLC